MVYAIDVASRNAFLIRRHAQAVLVDRYEGAEAAGVWGPVAWRGGAFEADHVKAVRFREVFEAGVAAQGGSLGVGIAISIGWEFWIDQAGLIQSVRFQLIQRFFDREPTGPGDMRQYQGAVLADACQGGATVKFARAKDIGVLAGDRGDDSGL